ncbi:MAG: hypothetical protein JWO45_1822 [Spartobacteria bacterium]|nr:hypothetical protein [Spartobacteria bacterium]
MNKIFRSHVIAIPLALIVTLVTARFVGAVDKKDARVTQVVHDVKLLTSQSAARPASVNETVREGTAVRTGGDSRAELTFNDQSLTRLGANTVFSFGAGGRDFNLTSGAILVAVPSQAGPARIKTAAVTAAISGGVAMAEFHKQSWVKFIVLEGQGVVTLVGSGKTLTLLPGQILTLPPGAKTFAPVHNIDLKKLTDKSRLVRSGRLPPWIRELIKSQVDKQQSSPDKGGLQDPSGFEAIDQRAATETTPKPVRTRPPG